MARVCSQRGQRRQPGNLSEGRYDDPSAESSYDDELTAIVSMNVGVVMTTYVHDKK